MKKPFNLEKFLAGEPAVSRNGRKVVDFHLYKEEYMLESRRLQVLFEGDTYPTSLYKEGCYYSKNNPHYADLFMAPKEEKLWVVLIMGWSGSVLAYTFKDEKNVIAAEKDPEHIKTITTTIEV